MAERAENIGIWFKILEMLAKLAVISNVSKLCNFDTVTVCLREELMNSFKQM